MIKFVKCVTYTSTGETDCEMLINPAAIIRVLSGKEQNKVTLYLYDGTSVIVDVYAASELGIKL